MAEISETFRGTIALPDLDATARLGAAGLLGLGITALHARFNQFVVGSIDNTGNHVQAAPDFSVNARYQYTFDLARGQQLGAFIASTYVDGHYVANNNPRGSFQSSYTKTAVGLSVQSANRAWTITAFARNLENEAVMASYSDPISRGGDIAFLEPPRTYGVTITWSLP